jgi:hypothetical protein
MRDSRDVAIPSMHKDEAAALSPVKVEPVSTAERFQASVAE